MGYDEVRDQALEYCYLSKQWACDLRQVVAVTTGTPILWKQREMEPCDAAAGLLERPGMDIVIVVTAQEHKGKVVLWRLYRELGHIALRHPIPGKLAFARSDDVAVEREANVFALCCLLAEGHPPADIFYAVLKRLNDESGGGAGCVVGVTEVRGRWGSGASG